MKKTSEIVDIDLCTYTVPCCLFCVCKVPVKRSEHSQIKQPKSLKSTGPSSQSVSRAAGGGNGNDRGRV